MMPIMCNLMKCDYKILLIGSKGSGKTSLVNRFLGKSFSSRMKPTIGFNLITLDLNLENDHLINVELWDTAGGENILSNAEFYYRDVNLVIAVFDMSQSERSFSDCSIWIKDFLKHRDIKQDVKIMIVGNKIDKNDEMLIDSYIMEYIKQIDAIMYKTSARTLEGTKRLFDDVIKLIIESFAKQQQEQLNNNGKFDESMQTWCLVSADLSSTNIEMKNIRKTYEQSDYDPFNGQIHYSNASTMDNDKKTKPSLLSLTIFLRKIFCLM